MTFLGASPVEWLTVRYLASGDGQLNQWLDTVLRAIGFPVLPPSHLLVDLPVLLEGTDQPVGPADLDRLQVDALRLYTASAEWPGGDRRLFRLYVVQARRGSRSWSVELSFDSAVAPGMAHELVEQADDPRAAAVFSDLRLTS